MEHQVRLLFQELAGLRPEQRESYFSSHPVPPDIRREVEGLLAFDRLVDDGTKLASSRGEVLDEITAANRSHCGPYRLIRLLGRGGMGTVYLAERADQEIEQLAAVKLLRFGGNEPAFYNRFLRERQILATLHHPAIAGLLDAGHTSDGQPYLAMEYVDGVAIDVYAETLELRDKLLLFRKVCDAVSYAHRNLIVHRDIKPSNILVDRQGAPKLLDFGIAKILDPDEHSDHSMTVFQALTPQYASPEQVRGENITTSSDVYSLGVLLYKLLTGSFPYEFETTSPAAVSRIISEQEPAPPQVSEDLDNILLMALRREPERRYRSVQDLADDIDRTLTDRPVKARPDTIRYRAGKFIRRHRFSFTAALLAFSAIAAGSAIAVHEAEVAQRRFQDVRKLAHTFVFDLHDDVAKLEGTTKARETMVRIGLEYLDNLARTDNGDLDLQSELAAAYMKIGDAQGYPTKPNLGHIADAVASYRKAGDIYRRLAAKSASYLPDLAKYYLAFAGLMRFTGDGTEARATSEAAIETLDNLRRVKPLDQQLEYNYLASWCTIGDLDEDHGHYRLAWDEFSRCRELAQAFLNRKRDRRSLIALAMADERVGTAAQELGLLSRALSAFNEDESMLSQLEKAEPRNPRLHRLKAVLYQFRSIAYNDDAYPSLADPASALASARQYLAAAEEMVGADPNNSSAQLSHAIALNRVAYSLAEFDPDAAVTMASESVRLFDQMMASGKSSQLIVSGRAQALERLAQAQLRGGRFLEAQRSAEAALKARRLEVNKKSKDNAELADVARALVLAGEANAAVSDFTDAEHLLLEAQSQASRIVNPEELTSLIPLAQAELALGELYSRQRRNQEARACYQHLAALWQKFPSGNEYVDRQRGIAVRLLSSIH